MIKIAIHGRTVRDCEVIARDWGLRLTLPNVYIWIDEDPKTYDGRNSGDYLHLYWNDTTVATGITQPYFRICTDARGRDFWALR